MGAEWTDEKESEFERLKNERRLERAKAHAQKDKENAKIRRERYRKKMENRVHSVGFQMDKTIYDFAKDEGILVGKSVREIAEAVGLFAIQNGLTFSQAVAAAIAKISPEESNESQISPTGNPEMDPGVIDALSN